MWFSVSPLVSTYSVCKAADLFNLVEPRLRHEVSRHQALEIPSTVNIRDCFPWASILRLLSLLRRCPVISRAFLSANATSNPLTLGPKVSLRLYLTHFHITTCGPISHFLLTHCQQMSPWLSWLWGPKNNSISSTEFVWSRKNKHCTAVCSDAKH